MSTYRLDLLGAPSITTGVGAIPTAKPIVFVAALYLTMNRGHAVRRTHLAALLWPDADDRVRSERFRWLVAQLKLYGIPLEPRAPEIRLDARDVVLDVDRLAIATSAADALSIVRGDALLGFEPKLSDTMTRWLEDTRDTLRSNAIRSLDGFLASALRAGEWHDVEALARRMLSLDPNNRNASRALSGARVAPHATSADALERQRSPLIGRRDVLARLTHALGAPGSFSRRLGVAGPPGMGKSRLVDEFCVIARIGGAQVAALRCGRGDRLRPLSLVADLARELLLMPGALGASPASVEILQGFTGEGAPVDASSSNEGRRAALYTALSDLVGAVTDEGALVVVIDDAQWAEPGSWAILSPILAQHAASPLCWVMAVRAETHEEGKHYFDIIYPPEAAASEQNRELHWLLPLQQLDLEALCTARALPQSISPEALGALTAKSSGIPFIAEALVDHWLVTGDASTLPPSVGRLVDARLDHLSPAADRALATIAILGADAALSALESIATLDRSELLVATRELDTAGILQTVDGLLSPHALWTEAILRRTPRTTLRLLHRFAAEWLERSNAEREVIEPRRHWSVVTHWFDAGEPEKARRGLDNAAAILSTNGFSAEAAQMLARAAEIAGVSESALYYLQRAAELYLMEHGQSVVDSILRIHARYDDTARALDPRHFSRHHEVELMAQIAINRTRALPDDVIKQSLECALDVTAPTMHRIKASSHTLHSYRRSTLDRSIADLLGRNAEEVVAGNEQEQIEIDLCLARYYLHVAEDPERALARATRARAAIERGDARTDRRYPGAMDLVANSYECLGDLESSQEARRETVRCAQQWKRGHLVLYAMQGLIANALEAGHIAEARELLADFTGAADDETTLVSEARAIYRTVCALEEGDSQAARRELTAAIRCGVDSPEGMVRSRALAIYVHLALLENDDETGRRLLPRLVSCFGKRREFMDHPAYVAAMGLERYEGEEAAAAFVRRYVGELRIDRWTPRPELQRFLEPATASR